MTKTSQILCVLSSLAIVTPAMADNYKQAQKSGCGSSSKSSKPSTYTPSGSSSAGVKPIASTSSGFKLEDHGTSASLYRDGKFVGAYHASTSGNTKTWVGNGSGTVLLREPTPAGSQVVQNDATKTITIPLGRNYTNEAIKLWTLRGYNVQTSSGSNVVAVNPLK